jgi:hypothetical protein
VNEGLRRLDLSVRLNPDNPGVVFARAHVLALVGQKEKARSAIDDLIARAGILAAVVILSRFVVWWQDKELAARTADAIENAKSGAAWDDAAVIMRNLIDGKLDARADDIAGRLTEPAVAPKRRAIMHEVCADFYALLGEPEKALVHIATLAKLPSTNLLWMDACPTLVSVRDDPRFAEARAMVAARVAQLWGSVGTWPNETQ